MGPVAVWVCVRDTGRAGKRSDCVSYWAGGVWTAERRQSWSSIVSSPRGKSTTGWNGRTGSSFYRAEFAAGNLALRCTHCNASKSNRQEVQASFLGRVPRTAVPMQRCEEPF